MAGNSTLPSGRSQDTLVDLATPTAESTGDGTVDGPLLSGWLEAARRIRHRQLRVCFDANRYR